MIVLFQQYSDSADVNESEERGIELVIASKDSAEPLEFLEKTLNQMTLFIGMPVHRPRSIAVLPRRDGIGGALPIIEEVSTLWDWDYPCFPMDPCFYKKGYSWFAVSTHEHWNKLFLTEDPSFPLASDLESIGVTLFPGKAANVSDFYFNRKIAHMC